MAYFFKTFYVQQATLLDNLNSKWKMTGKRMNVDESYLFPFQFAYITKFSRF